MQLADIIDDASDAVRSAVEAAYEAGKIAGRAEAKADLQSRLSDFLAADRAPVIHQVEATEGAKLSDHVDVVRAAPGSVKPVIEKMLLEARDGLTPSEIVERTGLKFNSVRGTLWTLGNDKFAEKRPDGRWVVRSAEAGDRTELHDGPQSEEASEPP